MRVPSTIISADGGALHRERSYRLLAFYARRCRRLCAFRMFHLALVAGGISTCWDQCSAPSKRFVLSYWRYRLLALVRRASTKSWSTT